MAHTPKEMKVKVDLDHPVVKSAIEDAHRLGREEGLNKGRTEILDWLEKCYLDDPGRPDRGTPRADAMLQLAQEASEYFKKLSGGRRGRK